LLFGGLFIGMLGMVLTLGVAAIKIGLFIVLPAWLVWKLFTKVFRRGGDSHGGTNGGSAKSDTSSDTSTSPSSSAATDPIDGIDPA
jgi:predicted lipid-binding transport protein (Tim44 family)